VQGSRFTIAGPHRIGAQEGQALVEYALILGVVALLTIGALLALGHTVSGLLVNVSSGMSKVLNS
jgi:Flp pilus assembly pilin Flp